jgi:hypothetical protein
MTNRPLPFATVDKPELRPEPGETAKVLMAMVELERALRAVVTARQALTKALKEAQPHD